MNSYQTIKDVEEILYKDKGSKFIGFAYSVKDEIEILEKLMNIKTLHPKASHHCYAYRLGLDKNNFRANDDGEPSGTAGKPILGQIDSKAITNCLVIVVRYYGGTKLGVPGLIAAYKDTARMTLDAAPIVTHTILDYYELKCSYTSVNLIYQLVHQFKAAIHSQQLDNTAVFVIAMEQDQSAAFELKMKEDQIEFKFLRRE